MNQISNTSFAPDWLALREPADHAARDANLLARAAACVSAGQIVLDLGSGTGSTVRAFAKAGFPQLEWRLFDNDAVLLEIARASHPSVEIALGNLRSVAHLPLENVGLVTCSALLDLMPLSWVSALAAHLAAHDIPFYGALSYDGVMEWTPADPADAAVTAAFNAHQRGNKGLGPALGPDAVPETAAVFVKLGYNTATANSPWQLSRGHAALHKMLVEGIGDAAADADPAVKGRDWAARRIETADVSDAIIGHSDLLAIPGSKGGQHAAD